MPEDTRAQLHRQLAPYRRRHTDARWTRPRTWHLTLLFLGAVAPDRLPELEWLTRSVAEAFAPYHATADRGGGRTRGREGTAWLSLSAGAGVLIEAATFAADRCPADITDGPPPKRTPSAHLTVARRADQPLIEALRSQAHGPVVVNWEIDRVQLVRSHLDPGGAHYVTLDEATL